MGVKLTTLNLLITSPQCPNHYTTKPRKDYIFQNQSLLHKDFLQLKTYFNCRNPSTSQTAGNLYIFFIENSFCLLDFRSIFFKSSFVPLPPVLWAKYWIGTNSFVQPVIGDQESRFCWNVNIKEMTAGVSFFLTLHLSHRTRKCTFAHLENGLRKWDCTLCIHTISLYPGRTAATKAWKWLRKT